MDRSNGRCWVVAATSAQVRWETAAAALAAAAASRVAVLSLGPPAREPYPLLREHVATHLEIHDGASDPLTLDDVAGLARALARTHGLVLVGADRGLVVPLGRDGWTLINLSWALSAPVVVATGGGPDATNHATLALDALAQRHLPATVVTVGTDEDPAGLPVTPAGRIPPGAEDDPEGFAAAAPGWLHPVLHATGGRLKSNPSPTLPDPSPSGAEASADVPPDVDQPGTDQPGTDQPGTEPPGHRGARAGTPAVAPMVLGAEVGRAGRAVDGRRVVVGLAALFVCAVLAVCALAAWGPGSTPPRHSSVVTGVTEIEARPGVVVAPVPAPVTTARRPAEAACPRRAVRSTAARPDPRTVARVDAAWQRIETWLAARAPRTRASLRPPATPQRIAAAEAALSVRFPDDLVASLRRHDGVTHNGFTLPPFFTPMPVGEIPESRRVSCEVLANETAGGAGDWWHPEFVPFAKASDGGALVVDQRPGGHGRVGEFFAEEGTDFDAWPASVAALLEGTAGSLETGRAYRGDYRPVVKDGTLGWEIV